MPNEIIQLSVAVGAVLALVALRNTHLSQRSRDVVSEAIGFFKKEDDFISMGEDYIKNRFIDLYVQNCNFIERYHKIARSLTFCFVSYMIMILAYITKYYGIDNISTIKILSIIFLFYGVLSVAFEHMNGYSTLVINSRVMERLAELKQYKTPKKSIFLQRLFKKVAKDHQYLPN